LTVIETVVALPKTAEETNDTFADEEVLKADPVLPFKVVI
jgi:hypothetical protein